MKSHVSHTSSSLSSRQGLNTMPLFMVLCFMVLFLGSVNLWGQTASSYTFTATSGTYTALTGTTNTSLGATDDEGLSSVISIPFPFRFGGINYIQIKVSSNGWVTFGSTSDPYYVNSQTNANNARPILFPLWDDLQNMVIPRYVTTGSAPDRIFKLEWPQQEWNYNSGGHVISFQVWLYEGTNIIEYIYNRGPDGVNNGSASIGIFDNGGTYLTLNGSGTNPSAQSGTFTTNIASKPVNGQIYRFTPPAANYRAYFYSTSFGSSSWCAGETRNVTVTVKNTGTATWTNASPDINIGVKWNANIDYLVRTDANGLAPGASQSYTLAVMAPVTAGSNNLSFDAVNEGSCWFAWNSGLCGPGNSIFTSSAITIVSAPVQPTASVVQTTCPESTNGAITLKDPPVALDFGTGTPDKYIDMGTSFLSNLSQFTVEGWIKFNRDLFTTSSRFSLFGQNNVIEFGFLTTYGIYCWTPGGGSASSAISNYPDDDAWHHIAAVGNGTNILLYVDGNQVGSGGTATGNYGTSTPLYTVRIGSGVFDNTGGTFPGQIIRTGFWNTALNQYQIASMAYGFSAYTGSESGLIAGYNYYEGTGTTLGSAPAGHNGTLTNSPAWTDPYTYAWTMTGVPGFSASTRNISGLSSGEYNLTVSQGSCSKTASYTVNSTYTSPTYTYSKTDITCFNAGDGTITITAGGGSGSPYQYRINGGSGWIGWQSGNVFQNLGPGTYTVEVKDSAGCVQTECN